MTHGDSCDGKVAFFTKQSAGGLAFGLVVRQCVCTLSGLKSPPPHSTPCSGSKMEVFVENCIVDV